LKIIFGTGRRTFPIVLVVVLVLVLDKILIHEAEYENECEYDDPVIAACVLSSENEAPLSLLTT